MLFKLTMAPQNVIFVAMLVKVIHGWDYKFQVKLNKEMEDGWIPIFESYRIANDSSMSIKSSILLKKDEKKDLP